MKSIVPMRIDYLREQLDLAGTKINRLPMTPNLVLDALSGRKRPATRTQPAVTTEKEVA